MGAGVREVNVRYFNMGRIYAESEQHARDMLGPGIVSLKRCYAQVRPGLIWFEYIQEITG